jgi:hypothetical protein
VLKHPMSVIALAATEAVGVGIEKIDEDESAEAIESMAAATKADANVVEIMMGTVVEVQIGRRGLVVCGLDRRESSC